MAVADSASRDAASGPLGGALVVECGQGVAASFAAKLLSQLGAEVIKVEPPQGDVTRTRGPFPEDRPDPNRSGLFMYLNANKLGVTLDLKADADRDRFHGLLARADILVHNVLPPDRDGAGLNSGALASSVSPPDHLYGLSVRRQRTARELSGLRTQCDARRRIAFGQCGRLGPVDRAG